LAFEIPCSERFDQFGFVEHFLIVTRRPAKQRQKISQCFGDAIPDGPFIVIRVAGRDEPATSKEVRAMM